MIENRSYINLSSRRREADEAGAKKLKRLFYLWRGDFLQKENIDVGFCDEFTSLGLVMILQTNKEQLYSEAIKIEVICLEYIDDDGRRNDGHVFLAINRKPDSQLNDFSQWGKQAIVFDPWNKLVCFAQDIDKLPIYYFSFPEGARWKVEAEYDQLDTMLLTSLSDSDRDFYLTGNHLPESRIPLLMEEYELTSLHDPKFKNIKLFLQQLSTELTPKKSALEIEFFLTTAGGQLIWAIPGFADPKIALHVLSFYSKFRGNAFCNCSGASDGPEALNRDAW